jgi:GNAT superfamily N-acetyltransferase
LSIELRVVETDADVEAWLHVRRVVLPNESAGTVAQFRGRQKPEQLALLAELGGSLAGSGLAGLSDASGRGFVAPRVLPEARRRGVGTALLERLGTHVAGLGVDRAGTHVDDEGSRAFAEHFGFEEIDRQVEQIWRGGLPQAETPAGVDFVTVAERPELLEAAYPLAKAGWEDFATAEAVTISREDFIRDDATLPEGSFVALAGGEIVGFSGLCAGDHDGVAEDGLTVVHRDWRRRGLARALKARELEWAAANGYREVVTWTQRGNEGMRALNEQLGYAYRGFSITMTAPLPIRTAGSSR